MRLKHALLVGPVLFSVGLQAFGQSRPPAGLAGCYTLTRGAWEPGFGRDSIFHVLPKRLRLDTIPAEHGGWRLNPNISYPYLGEFRGAPSWQVVGASVRLLWSDGYNPTIVTLLASDSELVGEAVAISDFRPPRGWPDPRARVVLRRRACGKAQVRPPPL